MKKGIYLLLLAIILLVCYTLFNSARTHVEAVKVADELVVKTDSLTNKVTVLHKEKETAVRMADSALKEIDVLDSTLTVKDLVISSQNSNLNTLRRDAIALKKMGPIIVHDTVYITETKNFWGKKKKTIENVSSTDTLDLEEALPDSVIEESKTDTIQ